MHALSVMILLAALVLPSRHASASPPIDISAEELQTLHKQAAQGNAEAQCNLGALYASGQGVPQDYSMAREWYEKADVQGFATAQSQLGWLYRVGQGVPQDNVRAYMWFNIAAAHSTGDAQKLAVDNRDKVVNRMTPAQVAEAQRLAQQCQAQQFKGC